MMLLTSVNRSILALLSVSLCGSDGVDVQELVRRATDAMLADWAAASGFAFVQRDLTTSKGKATCKTHQVFMISGSDYYMPIAIDNKALPADQQKLELERLKQEIVRRSEETPQETQQRSERYRKMREQNGILINEFTKAFNFTLAGEEITNGQATYVLDARPRPTYRPPNRTARILTGMQGRLWIDRESFHWVKAEAEALKPISMFGLFARVLPGTKMKLEMRPVTDSVWLVSRFAMDIRFSILWRKSVKSSETAFSGYEPASAALARMGLSPLVRSREIVTDYRLALSGKLRDGDGPCPKLTVCSWFRPAFSRSEPRYASGRTCAYLV